MNTLTASSGHILDFKKQACNGHLVNKAKGIDKVTKSELSEIRKLSLPAQRYEQSKFEIEEPSTLAGIIRMKMYEMRRRQKDLAKKLMSVMQSFR